MASVSFISVIRTREGEKFDYSARRVNGRMTLDTTERVHVAPMGFERDRIVEPVTEYSADRVVLLSYIQGPSRARVPDDVVEAALTDRGIACEINNVKIENLYDCVHVYGRVFNSHDDDDVYVNLASGNKLTAAGGVIASMVTDHVQPYYVKAEDHGSHHPPAPKGVESIDSVPSYFIERPEQEHLAIMDYIASSDRMNRDGDPYRIKRELFEFGERSDLPFMAEYDGETSKGKFRRLQAHIVSPLSEKGYLNIKEVGTQDRVFLTKKGEKTLHAFQYLIE